MVKAVAGHSRVGMLKNGGSIRQRELATAPKRRETEWNEAGPNRESFNACLKNEAEGDSE